MQHHPPVLAVRQWLAVVQQAAHEALYVAHKATLVALEVLLGVRQRNAAACLGNAAGAKSRGATL